MLEKKIKIINKLGLHARAATKFAKVANRFGCNIEVSAGGKDIDGKSVMSLMLLAAAKGSDIQLKLDGSDEQEAMAALEELVSNRFDEEE